MTPGIMSDQDYSDQLRQLPPSPREEQPARSYTQSQPAASESEPLHQISQSPYVNGIKAGSGEGDSPDDFYRSYGMPSIGHTYNTRNGPTITAGGPSSPQQSLHSRSNGNGTTSRHLPVAKAAPSSQKVTPTANNRTLPGLTKSSPNLNGPTRARQVSGTKVSELSKRFDQSSAQNKAAPAKMPIKVPSRGAGPDNVHFSRRPLLNESQPLPVASKAPFTTTKVTQRPKFVAEDQHSNNTLSGVARPARTRHDATSLNTSPLLPPVLLSPPRPPKIPLLASDRKLLFGELPSETSGTPGTGYGIHGTHPRRTSVPNLHIMTSSAQQVSDNEDKKATVVDSRSPTAWYREMGAQQATPSGTQRVIRGHNRSHSASASTGTSTGSSNGTTTATPIESVSKQSTKASSPASRLPVATKRRQMSTSSDSSSVPSSRAPSPFSSKVSHSNGRPRLPENRPWNPAGRAATPINRPMSRQSVSSGKASSEDPRLKAYASTPPAPKSPPLRRSRDRSSVATATTASSRNRAAEREVNARAEAKPSKKDSSEIKYGARSGRSDFSALRARVQKGIDHAMQENEDRTLGSADNRPNLGEGVPAAYGHAANNPDAASRDFDITTSEIVNHPRLALDTTFVTPNDTAMGQTFALPSRNMDSPTLGMPGSFPRDHNRFSEEAPQSAISTATGFTEFDPEPQTDAPQLSNSSASASASADQKPQSLLEEANDGASIQIILDTGSFNSASNAEPLRETDTFPDSTFIQAAVVHGISDGMPSPQADYNGFMATQQSQGGYAMHNEAQTLEHTSAANKLEPLTRSLDDVLSQSPQNLIKEDSEAENSTELVSQVPVVTVHVPTTPISEPHQTKSASNYDKVIDSPVTEIEYESSGEEQIPFSTPRESSTAHYSGRFSDSHEQSYHTSQQTTWAGLTINENKSATTENSEPPLPALPAMEYRPPLPPKVRPASPKPDVPPKPPSYTPQPSPRPAGDPPGMANHIVPSHSEASFESQLDHSTGGSSRNSATSIGLNWSSHPPPPPQPTSTNLSRSSSAARTPPPISFYNRRPPSSIFQTTQNGISRETDSRRASEDTYSARPSVSTTRSSTQLSITGSTIGDGLSLEQSAQTLPNQSSDLSEAELKTLRHRWQVLNELISSEAAYLKDMNVVEEIYKGTAEACPNLEPGDVGLLFRNSDQLIAFSTAFLADLKRASAGIYSTRSQRTRQSKITNASASSAVDDGIPSDESDFDKDQRTRIGEIVLQNFQNMRVLYTKFLEKQEQAERRLQVLQEDRTASVWLRECDDVAKDLTQSWDLSSLLIKPFQRITKYPLLLDSIRNDTPKDHPDFQALTEASSSVKELCLAINKYKSDVEKVIQSSSGRKRKESDFVGLFKAFQKRDKDKDKDRDSIDRQPDDPEYVACHEKFHEDFLRLQVIFRDTEFAMRVAQDWVQNFVQFATAIELVIRSGSSSHPELESKWIQFSRSIRELETVGVPQFSSKLKKSVIDPIERLIKLHDYPGHYIRQRAKRRPDHEKYEAAVKSGKKIDDKLEKQEELFQATNMLLKDQLPQLSEKASKVGSYCYKSFIAIMLDFYEVWQLKLKVPLDNVPPSIAEIVENFRPEFKPRQQWAEGLAILNGNFHKAVTKNRLSQSNVQDDVSSGSKSRPPTIGDRSRGLSINSDQSPSLPTPDFGSTPGQFTFSPMASISPGFPHTQTRESSATPGRSRPSMEAPAASDGFLNYRPPFISAGVMQSHEQMGTSRENMDVANAARYLSDPAHSTLNRINDSDSSEFRHTSSIFNSAMPMDEAGSSSTYLNRAESARSSLRSSHHSQFVIDQSESYNPIWLAVSLFEFQIDETKIEGGFPYLTYQAGEIFDVIAEKGEIWLAKNQDDASNVLGWIWSKHFARLNVDD